MFAWLIAIYSTQFYIFSSGLPQPSHVLLSLIFFFMLVVNKVKFNVSKDSKAEVQALFVFVLYVCIVNATWSIFIGEFLLFSILFWLFSICTFFFTRMAIDSQAVRVGISIACFIGPFTLLFLWIVGLGRYEFGARFNGYFNDPNQMAFWTVCSLSIYYYIGKTKNYPLLLIFTLVCIVVVLTTASRSASIAILFTLIGVICHYFQDRKRNYAVKVVGVGVCLGIVIPFFVYLIVKGGYLQSVIDRFNNADLSEQAAIRGYMRLVEYPQYLIFGSGQGMDNRFGIDVEIHSTWAGIGFYYGVVGLSLFLAFLYIILSRLNIAQSFVFLGPLMYGFFTYGARTPIFWVFVAAASYAAATNVSGKTYSKLK